MLKRPSDIVQAKNKTHTWVPIPQTWLFCVKLLQRISHSGSSDLYTITLLLCSYFLRIGFVYLVNHFLMLR